MSKLQVL